MGPVGWQTEREEGEPHPKACGRRQVECVCGQWGAAPVSFPLRNIHHPPHFLPTHTPDLRTLLTQGHHLLTQAQGNKHTGPWSASHPTSPPRDRGAPAPPTGAKRKWLLSWAGGGGSQQLLAARAALAPGSSEKGQRQVSSRELPTCSSPFWQSPGTPFTHSVLHPLSKAGTAGQARGPKTSIALLGFD